jgi:hypothetical protein
MNREELLNKLRQNLIDPRDYSIIDYTAPPIDEQFVLTRERNMWVIYYYERGNRNEENFFLSEDEACVYFLTRLLKLPEYQKKDSLDITKEHENK